MSATQVMRAAVYHRYGPPDVVRVEQIARPTPKSDEVLVRVRATTVSSGDARLRSLRVPAGFGLFARPMFGFFAPRQKVLGTELAGEVVAVGSAVQSFKVGDHVFAFPGIKMGAHAEYRTIQQDGPIVPMPAGLGFSEAAALSFGGTTALYFLRDRAKVAPGEKVLVIGGSGAVGSAGIQIAKSLGAEVTAVTSGKNAETVRALGADRVLDYTTGNYLVGERYDVIFETVGVVAYVECKTALAPGGRLLLAAGGLPQILSSLWRARGGGHKVFAGGAGERREDLRYLKELAESGRYRPLIERTYPLAQIAEAHAHVDSGRKRGSVVITID